MFAGPAGFAASVGLNQANELGDQSTPTRVPTLNACPRFPRWRSPHAGSTGPLPASKSSPARARHGDDEDRRSPLSVVEGRSIEGVRRIGKMPIVGELSPLVHLMSAGRLQVFDKRASMRDRRSRLLIRLSNGRELRLREFGTKQRAWAKLLRDGKWRATRWSPPSVPGMARPGARGGGERRGRAAPSASAAA